MSLAVAKVRWPISPETMKKCPVQPRRASTSPAYKALLPPSSKVSTRNRPGRVKSISVTRVGRASLAAIWMRWSSKARGVSVYGNAPGRWNPVTDGSSVISWYPKPAIVGCALIVNGSSSCERHGRGPARAATEQGPVVEDTAQIADAVGDVHDGHDRGERRGAAEAVFADRERRSRQYERGVRADDGGQCHPRERHPNAEQRGRDQTQHEQGRHELARHDALGLARDQRLEVAVLVEHPGDRAEGAARVVPGHDVRQQQNPPAVPDHAEVELVVLVADHFLVEHPDALEQFPPEAAEGNGIHPAGARDADAEIRISHAERVRERQGDAPGDGRVVGGEGHDHHAGLFRHGVTIDTRARPWAFTIRAGIPAATVPAPAATPGAGTALRDSVCRCGRRRRRAGTPATRRAARWGSCSRASARPDPGVSPRARCAARGGP